MLPIPLALAALANVQPTGPVSLIDARLGRTQGVVQRITPEELLISIDGAPARAISAERWIGFASEIGSPEPSPTLILTDGQRFIGAPVGGSGEALRWRAASAGMIEAPLERIDRVVLAPSLDPGHDPAALGDVVILTNGDRLDGYVASLGDRIEIEVEDGRMVDLPMQRAAVIDLANPPAERSGAYMWFADGAVARLRREEGQYWLDAAPSGWESTAPLERARAFVYDAARITALSDLPVGDYQPISRRWTPAPIINRAAGAPLWSAPVELPGPMRVIWALPDNAVRFGAIIALREDSRVWGDCEVVVAQQRAGAQVELGRVRLDSAQPSAQLTVDVAPGDLVITVEPGASGPIQDRVRITGALLLTDSGS